MSDPRHDLPLFHRVKRLGRRRHSAGWTFTVNIWPDELDGGFGAECLELPGCFSQGETEDEALANIMDAITEVLASMLREAREAGSSAPAPPGRRREVKIALSA